MEKEGREGEGEEEEEGEVEGGEVVAGGKGGMIEAEAVELSSGGVEGGGGRGALRGFGIGWTENRARGGGGSGVGVDIGTEGVEREGGEVEEMREKETGHGGDEVEEERRDRRNVHGRKRGRGECEIGSDLVSSVGFGLVGSCNVMSWKGW